MILETHVEGLETTSRGEAWSVADLAAAQTPAESATLWHAATTLHRHEPEGRPAVAPTLEHTAALAAIQAQINELVALLHRGASATKVVAANTATATGRVAPHYQTGSAVDSANLQPLPRLPVRRRLKRS